LNNPAIEDIKFFLAENEKMPVNPPVSLISEYAQSKRILPPSTPFPGPWKNRRTPYAIEIMDNMGPFSPIQETRVMKAAQIGLTATSENVIAYWMDESPAEILYVSATESLLMKWTTKRLEPLIDSCGFRHKIYAQTESKASRRTGDKIFSKEYVGGNLDMASSQSASSLRSDSKRILIIDEMDGAPPLLRTGEGNWVKVAMARTNAWGARKKILKFSTPTTFDASLINVEYEEGDQRKYMVPCPLCGKYQELKFGNEQTQYGIKADTQAGELKNVFYLCDYCHDATFNHNKTKMLTNGRWEPSSVSASKTLRTYQISSLYSPVGMYSWSELYLEHQNAQNNPDGMRSFVNLYLGLPYKESGSRPDIKKVIELRGGYRAGTVPDGVLYLTAGIDVQQGSKKDPNNPPRLEMEVLGIGAGYRTYSILYQRFEGDVDDPYSGAWLELNEWAKKGGLRFKRKDGFEFPVAILFIDSGDGNLTDIVYRFTEQWQNTYPSKGFSALRKRKNEKADVDSAGPLNFKRYRPVNVSGTILLYEISTNFYKNQVYNNLKIVRQEIDPQRPGFCDFPVDYGEKYFKMLTAEEKRRDGSFYCPSGRRNESLDCRVMALCAADVYLASIVMERKALAKANGASATDLQMINHRAIIQMLKQEYNVS
jgi:phage terminase large subunit GpA-like protein